ncbi:MAG: nitroreductase family protein [Candidatus Pacebacteria bacterium]|nr:nitroreductase family protein [Candidatus Paceibacterota bacterium]
MDILSFIKSRRSVRIFEEKIPDKEAVEKIIEAASFAPSACNEQGWHFIVIDDTQKKQQIIDMGGSANIKNSPLGILVLYDSRTKNSEYADNVQSAAAATQNMLLMAHDLGLGACWTCHLPPKRQLKKIFHIPSHLEPVAYVLLGYKKTEPIDVPRKWKNEEIISYNIFASKKPQEKNSKIKTFLLKLLLKIYFLIPVFVKKKWLNKFVDKNFVKKFEN